MKGNEKARKVRMIEEKVRGKKEREIERIMERVMKGERRKMN